MWHRQVACWAAAVVLAAVCDSGPVVAQCRLFNDGEGNFYGESVAASEGSVLVGSTRGAGAYPVRWRYLVTVRVDHDA